MEVSTKSVREENRTTLTRLFFEMILLCTLSLSIAVFANIMGDNHQLQKSRSKHAVGRPQIVWGDSAPSSLGEIVQPRRF